jgi:DNA/RNA endonuclease YhcR with UshA esterase domain
MTIALFGLLAIALAAGGLALLYVASVSATVPTVRIGQIQAAMNYAYVRIEGIVRRSPAFNPEAESLSFWVDDGSGQMLVMAFRPAGRALIEADRVPSIGDRVAVEGALRVRDESPSLTLSTIDALAITRVTDSASPREISSITPDDALIPVMVRGQVRAVRQPYDGLRLVTLRDASGEIDLAVERDAVQFGAPAPDVRVGDPIEATGVVTLFKGEPQVTVTRGDLVAVLDQPVVLSELEPIRSLGDDDIGRWVRVQGTIARIAPFSAGVKFTLSDPQGRDVTLLLWHDVFDALPDAADWQIGAEVVAQGPVSSFRGDLEIVPELPLDVSILTHAIAEEPATLRLAPLGAITPEDIGQTVFVSGTIESIDRFEDGVRFRLEDDTGSIRLVLFSNVYDQLDNGDDLQEGVSVSALGRVSEFNGALEVVPPNGASVRAWVRAQVAKVAPTPRLPVVTAMPRATPESPSATPTIVSTDVITPTARPTPGAILTTTITPTPTFGAVTAINTIDNTLIGQAVTVRGRVVETYSFSAGFRFIIDDGTGSIGLVLFDGRYREVRDQAALNLGAQVAVEAEVAEYNGALELQPASGEKVVVEEPGSTASIETRAINTLSRADIGRLATIAGDVLRVEGFSAGVSVFVNDGTGELRVVIFSNVLSFVPSAPSLQAGARARVTGVIDEFNGVLELVPALGYDVVVNP